MENPDHRILKEVETPSPRMARRSTARAMYDAEPLARNGYKVDIARAVLRRAMRALGVSTSFRMR